jgi:hypothetical protein
MAALEGVNSDLARERRNATFDVEKLTNVIYRGPEKVRRRRYLRMYSDLNVLFLI